MSQRVGHCLDTSNLLAVEGHCIVISGLSVV